MRRDETRARIEAALAHLLGEARPAGDVAVHPRVEDERPATARALDAALARQLVEGAADRDEAAAVELGELALRRHAITRLPSPVVERGAQVEIDLVVERHGAELETGAGQRDGPPPGRVGQGLRGRRLLITL